MDNPTKNHKLTCCGIFSEFFPIQMESEKRGNKATHVGPHSQLPSSSPPLSPSGERYNSVVSLGDLRDVHHASRDRNMDCEDHEKGKGVVVIHNLRHNSERKGR